MPVHERLFSTGRNMFKCPYCNQDSYNIKSKKKGKFESWDSVRRHISNCKDNNSEYYTDLIYGPIHYTKFEHKTVKQIRTEFPLLKISLDKLRNKFSIIIPRRSLSKEDIIRFIKEFYLKTGRIPQTRELNDNKDYPCWLSFKNHFGSFNEAIKAAGFEPDYNDGYGIRTTAKDGVLYRSQAEAYFVDNFLYGKYTYEYERKYDNHNKFYDFYIKELDLYIEIDGGLRPQIINNKVQINREENKNLLVLTASDIFSKKVLNELI